MAAVLAATVAAAVGCSELTDLEVLSREKDSPLTGAGLDGSFPADGQSPGGDAGIDGAITVTDAAASYRDLILGEGPAAYWRLGDKPGSSVAVDETNNGNNGTYAGGINLGAPGAIAGDSNQAVSMDGTGRVDVGDKLDFVGNRALSLEAWIAVPGAQEPGIVTKGGYRLFFWNEGIRFDHSGDNYCPCIAFEGDGGAIKDGGYHHIVATYDQVTMRIYYDGERVKNCECQAALPDDDAGVTLGAGLNGKLDEVAVYGRVLADPDVKRHYEAGKGIANP